MFATVQGRRRSGPRSAIPRSTGATSERRRACCLLFFFLTCFVSVIAISASDNNNNNNNNKPKTPRRAHSAIHCRTVVSSKHTHMHRHRHAHQGETGSPSLSSLSSGPSSPVSLFRALLVRSSTSRCFCLARTDRQRWHARARGGGGRQVPGPLGRRRQVVHRHDQGPRRGQGQDHYQVLGQKDRVHHRRCPTLLLPPPPLFI